MKKNIKILKKKLKNFDPKLKEECGVFGVSNAKDASALTALGLHALQHRGQEGCGIVTFDGEKYYSEKRFGLVGDNFSKEKVLKNLKGNYAIGHNRYSTTGENTLRNIQPFFADTNAGGIGVAHNGNLTNSISLRNKLVEDGAIFYTTSDTETIVQLIAKSKRPKTIDKVVDAIFQIQGGYALVMLTQHSLIGVRDPYGIRPLVIGKLGNSYVLASETCALDIIGAKFVRDVENGEIVLIENDKLTSVKPFPPKKVRPCVFEYIYFARPDSILDNKTAYEHRKNIGIELAKENDIDAVLAGIKSGIDITSTYYEGTPPIQWALLYESFQTLDILLESGASLNQRALDGSNVYHVCSMKTLDLIDETSIDIDARNLLGITPLHKYCYLGDEPEIVKSLILRGANPHAKCPYGREAMESMAAGNTEPEFMDLPDGIFEPISQHVGFSAMHFAASCYGPMYPEDFNTILNILLENGLDINEQDQYGQTPFMLAGKTNFDSDVPATLLQNGANLEMQDNYGNTVLHLLCAKEFYVNLGDRKDYINYKIEKFNHFLSSVKDLHKIIHVENDMGLTPLDCLCKNPEPGSVVFIKPLIEAGANPFHQNKFGKSSWDLMLNLPHFRNSQTFWEINQKRYTQ